MTVKECVLNILKNEPNLSNQEIADKVKQELNSKTTASNIAWYKWDLAKKNEIPQIEISDDDAEAVFGFGDAGEEDIKDWRQAEEIVADYERSKGAKVEHISHSQTPGYDIRSVYLNGETRLIEVKSKQKGKISWLQLTSNETTCLLNQPNFWLYLIEGNFASGKVQVVEISRENLLKAIKIKLHGRISNLLGYTRANFNTNSIHIKTLS